MKMKIDYITNWRIKLFFENADLNFKNIREKKERKGKIIIIIVQPDFQEDDWQLLMPPHIKNFGNHTTLHASSK